MEGKLSVYRCVVCVRPEQPPSLPVRVAAAAAHTAPVRNLLSDDAASAKRYRLDTHTGDFNNVSHQVTQLLD